MAKQVGVFCFVFPGGDQSIDATYIQHISSLSHHLVGGLEHVLFFHILGMIFPSDELIFSRGVLSTTNQSFFDKGLYLKIQVSDKQLFQQSDEAMDLVGSQCSDKPIYIYIYIYRHIYNIYIYIYLNI